MISRIPQSVQFAVLVIWLTGLIATSSILQRHSITPGAVGPTPVQVGSGSPNHDAVRQLRMFIHPHCPCTRASIAELSRVVAQSGENVQVNLVVVVPANAPTGWEESELVRSAVQAIPAAQVTVDKQGLQAQRFGVKTSGHVLLYNSRGALLFSGGVTPSRGHQGSCASNRQLLAMLTGSAQPAPQFPVFGCALFTPRSKSETVAVSSCCKRTLP